MADAPATGEGTPITKGIIPDWGPFNFLRRGMRNVGFSPVEKGGIQKPMTVADRANAINSTLGPQISAMLGRCKHQLMDLAMESVIILEHHQAAFGTMLIPRFRKGDTGISALTAAGDLRR